MKARLCRSAGALVVVALIAVGCGSGTGANPAAGTNPEPSSAVVGGGASATSLGELADRAVELAGGVPEAGVAVIVAYDNGSSFSEIAASISDGSLELVDVTESAASARQAEGEVQLIAAFQQIDPDEIYDALLANVDELLDQGFSVEQANGIMLGILWGIRLGLPRSAIVELAVTGKLSRSTIERKNEARWINSDIEGDRYEEAVAECVLGQLSAASEFECLLNARNQLTTGEFAPESSPSTLEEQDADEDTAEVEAEPTGPAGSYRGFARIGIKFTEYDDACVVVVPITVNLALNETVNGTTTGSPTNLGAGSYSADTCRVNDLDIRLSGTWNFDGEVEVIAWSSVATGSADGTALQLEHKSSDGAVVQMEVFDVCAVTGDVGVTDRCAELASAVTSTD